MVAEVLIHLEVLTQKHKYLLPVLEAGLTEVNVPRIWSLSKQLRSVHQPVINQELAVIEILVMGENQPLVQG